jgi:hypothetical protein
MFLRSKHFYLLAFGLLLTGCASSVERTTASGFIKDPDFPTVFRNLTSATVGAGFSIVSTSAETGQIRALYRDNAIDIALKREIGGISVQVTMVEESSFGGMISTSTARTTLTAFCDALTDVLPGSACAVQGKAKR